MCDSLHRTCNLIQRTVILPFILMKIRSMKMLTFDCRFGLVEELSILIEHEPLSLLILNRIQIDEKAP